MDRIEALAALLEGLRNESIDDFADLFYAVGSDVGIDFDAAEDYFDFLDVDKMTARLHHLMKAEAMHPAFLVDGVLHAIALWLEEEAARSRRQVRHNQILLAKGDALPEAMRALSEKTNGRLLSEEYEKRIMALRDRFEREKAERFSGRARLAWAEEDR